MDTLHEAVADPVALSPAFRSGKLSRAVLAANPGSIDGLMRLRGTARMRHIIGGSS